MPNSIRSCEIWKLSSLRVLPGHQHWLSDVMSFRIREINTIDPKQCPFLKRILKPCKNCLNLRIMKLESKNQWVFETPRWSRILVICTSKMRQPANCQGAAVLCFALFSSLFFLRMTLCCLLRLKVWYLSWIFKCSRKILNFLRFLTCSYSSEIFMSVRLILIC